jgi:hypothetical protein
MGKGERGKSKRKRGRGGTTRNHTQDFIEPGLGLPFTYHEIPDLCEVFHVLDLAGQLLGDLMAWQGTLPLPDTTAALSITIHDCLLDRIYS